MYLFYYLNKKGEKVYTMKQTIKQEPSTSNENPAILGFQQAIKQEPSTSNEDLVILGLELTKEEEPLTSYENPEICSDLPRVCPNCYLNYSEFITCYYGNPSLLIEYIQNHGLIKNECFCSSCGSPCRLDLNRKEWRCDKSIVVPKHRKRKRCNFRLSMYKGTWFENSHLDIETILTFCHIFVSDWFSYKFVRYELRLSDKTISDWCSSARQVIVNWVSERTCKIGGEGMVVELDESKFGKQKYSVERWVEGKWVFGGICWETRECFMVPVQNRNSETLVRLIKDYIEPGTTIISDYWKAKDCLEEEGFVDLQVNHLINFVNPLTGPHTNKIERHWRNVKYLVPKYGGRKSHFVGNLSVLYFKLHYREPLHRLHAFVEAAAKLYPPV